jgi:hypothetical protein
MKFNLGDIVKIKGAGVIGNDLIGEINWGFDDEHIVWWRVVFDKECFNIKNGSQGGICGFGDYKESKLTLVRRADE